MKHGFLFFTITLFFLPSLVLRAQIISAFREQQINISFPAAFHDTPSPRNENFLGQYNHVVHKTAAAQNQFYFPDSLVLYSSKGTYRYIAAGNSKGLSTQRLLQVWSNSQWVNYSLDNWTYLNENNNSVDIEQRWSNNQWTNYSLDSSTYDASGKMLVHLFKYWSDGAWVDSTLTFRTYDTLENMITDWGKHWTGTTWEILADSSHYTYTYDTHGHMLTQLYQLYTNKVLQDAALSTYTYDSNGNMLTFLYQIMANGTMTNYTYHTYTYNANGNILTDLYQGWTNNEWMNGALTTNTFDANGNLTAVLLQYWTNGQWTNTYQTVYTYDADGNVLTGNNTLWVNSAWTPADNTFYIYFSDDGSYYSFNGYKILISYTLMNSTDVAAVTKNNVTIPRLAQNYPNPFNPSTVITFSVPSKSFASLKIYDLLGKVVATLVQEELSPGTYSRRWNAAGISSGVYCYRLQVGSSIETKKLLLLK